MSNLKLDPPPNLWTDDLIDWYVKDEQVAVTFATRDGVLQSSVGPNGYHSGDALITGMNGDTWAVTPERFRERYKPDAGQAMGQNGLYRNHPVPIKAKAMTQAFSVKRSQGSDWLNGNAHDWLVQYSQTDYGIVDQKRFEMVYRRHCIK